MTRWMLVTGIIQVAYWLAAFFYLGRAIALIGAGRLV